MHSSHFATRLACIVALASIAACASAPATPTTTIPPVPRGDTAVATPQQPRGAPVAATFAYREGTYGYDLHQMTIVTVGTDSASRMEDTLVTAGSITYTIRSAGDTLAVTGVIDSLAVISSRDTSAAPRRLSAPVTLELRPATVVIPPPPGDSTVIPATCDSMEEAAQAIARDAHVRLPAGVQPGHRWTDSVTTAVCRGGIPMTATTVSNFEVQDVQRRGDSTLVLVARRATLTLAGTGMQGPRRITVAGNGTSETMFTYDLRGGAFVESSGQSVLQLRFETIQQTEQVTQRSTSRVRLRPAAR